MDISWATGNTKEEQGSQAWHEWRNGGIGASDVPAIMDASPWKNPYTLWLEKTNKKDPFKGNERTQRGKDLEPIARKKYEDMCLDVFPPAIMEYKEWPILRCSLDGINEHLHRIIEIKCPSESDHLTAKRGFVPTKYLPQCQAQLLITGYSELDYVSFDGTELAIVNVKPDQLMQAQILEKCKEFWKLVETNTPPVIDTDEVQVEDAVLEAKIAEYLHYQDEIKKLQEINDSIMEEVETLVAGRNIVCGAFKAQYIERKGTVEYAKIPQLKGVDLEPYRRASSRYIKLGRIKLSEDSSK